MPRIVFVDDESNVLDALWRNLQEQADTWTMSFLTSAREAIETHRQQPFDILVTDLRMPEMSGLELIGAMKAIRPDMSAIVLTGAADLSAALFAINEARVFRFYTKPTPVEQLVEGIRHAIAGARTGSTNPEEFLANTIGRAALDHVPVGVIVLAADTSVRFMNALGAKQVAAGDGLMLSAGGMCRASVLAETQELRRLVGLAIRDGATNAMALSRPSGLRPLSIVAAPLEATGQGADSAVLFVTDPEAPSLPSTEIVAKLFDLTDAEARLALALTRGFCLEDAAEELGVTINSARTYLKRIFMKTGVNRQAELVRLILAAFVPTAG